MRAIGGRRVTSSPRPPLRRRPRPRRYTTTATTTIFPPSTTPPAYPRPPAPVARLRRMRRVGAVRCALRSGRATGRRCEDQRQDHLPAHNGRLPHRPRHPPAQRRRYHLRRRGLALPFTLEDPPQEPTTPGAPTPSRSAPATPTPYTPLRR